MSRCTPVLVIHHIEKAIVFFKLLNKRFPFRFVSNVPIEHFLFYHISKLNSACSLFHFFLLYLIRLMSLLCLHNIFCKCINSI